MCIRDRVSTQSTGAARYKAMAARDYSPAKAQEPAAQIWEDSHLFYLRNTEPKRGAASLIEAQQSSLQSRVSVDSSLSGAADRVRKQRAMAQEQERRAFWHVKWAESKAESPSEAHKCLAP
eukprot:TRINITY_DN16477_c0_g1_i1.p2 TRINITY_DN16477_c0_g1~~TRINITY_DN16477_c0_g1_i1.p2  ORF type:complete len:121 (-),score=30.36 TRINITY_DN16477_c0_g1_i1:93-455(-)